MELALHTLFGSQKPQLVRCTRVVGIALSVVPILQDYSETIELLHQDLDDYKIQSCTTQLSSAMHLLPVSRFEKRLSPLVSPPM